jgi:anti-sigma regulatory factor (Ser/Thr protein kinase)
MGFAFMNAFMDEVLVESEPNNGTSVMLFKVLSSYEERLYEG